ncbi:hypothetical protein ABT09_03535 [bacterium SCN 57-13]|nr:MAG: hypothetical protein ABT09_03535 [bacterium SCN 57-13]
MEALGGFASTASSCSASGLTDDYTLRGWWAVVWVMGQSGLVIGIAHAWRLPLPVAGRLMPPPFEVEACWKRSVGLPPPQKAEAWRLFGWQEAFWGQLTD